ncbi:3549_t:CDS:2, partial [Racocetra fulgida]
KSSDIPSQTSRKPTVITVPTYEEVEANVPKPLYISPLPKPLKPIPPPEPIPGATVLLRACAARLDKERWHSSSNPKSAPTWEEYIKLYNHSTGSVIRSSIRRNTDKTTDKTVPNFKRVFIRRWFDKDRQNDSDEDSIDGNDDECFTEPNEKYPNDTNDFDHPIELDKEYPNDINDFGHPIELDEEYPNDTSDFGRPIEVDENGFTNNVSIIQKNNDIRVDDFSDHTDFRDKPYSNSLQEIQEENDYYDEHFDRSSRDDEPPNKRKKLICDTNHTVIPNSYDDNVESIEQINDAEHETILKKTQLAVTPDMDFFERLKILAPEAAAVYHEMEVVEESIDTDQANTHRVKNPYDKKAWFGKDTEKFYKVSNKDQKSFE